MFSKREDEIIFYWEGKYEKENFLSDNRVIINGS